MVQSCHRGEATTWATFYFYNMKKVDSLVGFILLALGLKGSNTHICACYSLTRWVQSVAKSGMARQWDAVKKKQMPCIPLTIMFLFPKNTLVPKQHCCQILGLHVHGLRDLSAVPLGTLDRHRVTSPKGTHYDMLHQLHPTPFNLIWSWILDVSLVTWMGEILHQLVDGLFYHNPIIYTHS